ncbi:bifunctional nuclease family protein [Pseudonocardia pini]|uniref:bifunctional nuclease family protein n=1 Tax=Pseudonocardia pini TaxID=2758030 RepID=UPI0015F0BAB7|nr:bifunctional nuclease family protein [Pseudonocardia pini]
MRAMRVLRLVVHALSRQPVLVLGEVDGPRCVPIFLRPQQAEVIAVGAREGEPETALSQDVLVPVVEALGGRLAGADITSLVDGVYTAELLVEHGSGQVRVSVRPSDALAVAVREGLAIGVAEEILDEVGQQTAELFPDGTDAPPVEQLREFREFLDEVSPDDFR